MTQKGEYQSVSFDPHPLSAAYLFPGSLRPLPGFLVVLNIDDEKLFLNILRVNFLLIRGEKEGRDRKVC